MFLPLPLLNLDVLVLIRAVRVNPWRKGFLVSASGRAKDPPTQLS
jgi:hypothetical protein